MLCNVVLNVSLTAADSFEFSQRMTLLLSASQGQPQEQTLKGWSNWHLFIHVRWYLNDDGHISNEEYVTK